MPEKFTTASLAKIDGGRIAAALERALHVCDEDCRDRPGLKKPRRVTLSITLTPSEVDHHGNLSHVELAFDVKEALPKRASRSYDMAAARGGLVYSELAPDDANQLTIDDLGPRGAVNAG